MNIGRIPRPLHLLCLAMAMTVVTIVSAETRISTGSQRATPPFTSKPLPSNPKQQTGADTRQVVYEGEVLVKLGKVQVAGGKVVAQPMAGFGSGWSGNAQLLWTGGAVGAVMDLNVDIKEPGNYSVELHMTRAPDYANLRLEVEGKASVIPVDLFARKVMPDRPLRMGTFALKAGPQKISFMIVGKNAQSTNFFVGLDYIVLSRVGDKSRP